MDELNSSEPSKRAIFWVSMHFFTLVSIIAYQCFLIFHVGLSISLKGCLIFLLQVLIYLANVLWVVPSAFKQNKSPVFAVRLASLVCTYVIVRGLIIFKATPVSGFILLVFSAEQQFFASLQMLLVLGVSLLLGFYKENERIRTARETALRAYIKAVEEKEHIKTIVYQMQLNPHIIFNTLNIIKVQSEGLQPNVSKAAQLLRNILRRSLIDPFEHEMVNLRNVLQELKNLVEVHQYLKDNKLFIVLSEEYDPSVDHLQMPPGLLFTIADNVFKYGHLHEEEYPGAIALVVRGSILDFKTFNYKKFGAFKGSGLGLRNVRLILEHYYPGRYTLKIDDLENTFSLQLIIAL